MRHFKKFLSLILFILLIASCSQNAEQPQGNAAGYKAVFSQQGEEEFKMYCITCHSLRYIEMQPPFPRKTWEKIVDKMVKNFGAPIPDSSAKVIVDYLVAVKGKQ
jgi:hypothetical protein